MCNQILFGSFKHNHISQLHEIIIRPNVEFSLVDDVGDDICLHRVDVGFGKKG